VNSDVIPLRFKTGTQQRSVVTQLEGTSRRVLARGWVGFGTLILELYWRTPRALVMYGKPATMQGGLTNRWTRAAGACFASSLVRRCLIEIAPPRQLNRWAPRLSYERIQNESTCHD